MHPKRIARTGAKAAFTLLDRLQQPMPGPRILIYHQVGVDLGREIEVGTADFERHLDWMQSLGRIVDLESAIARRDEPESDRLFVLTFDDGFEDVYLNAFPLLLQREVPFTLYLTTGPVETGTPLDPEYPDARPLTWDQVNEMVCSGLVTVAAHTHTHPDLRGLTKSAIEVEIDRSNALIESRTGVKPRHFTYPFGQWSAAADAVIRDRYETATVGSRPGLQGNSDLRRLARVPQQASDYRHIFKRKLITGSPTEVRLRSLRDRISKAGSPSVGRRPPPSVARTDSSEDIRS